MTIIITFIQRIYPKLRSEVYFGDYIGNGSWHLTATMVTVNDANFLYYDNNNDNHREIEFNQGLDLCAENFKVNSNAGDDNDGGEALFDHGIIEENYMMMKINKCSLIFIINNINSFITTKGEIRIKITFDEEFDQIYDYLKHLKDNFDKWPSENEAIECSTKCKYNLMID
ncbi:hypothetical protein Glove_60g115 [Diversispora epigaea]|uniref:Uncharacterized protein n=1 Tax=Diversispora epigaea TaxID=1348612 RepID=A0A397JMQ8_9GLOM|nr:hypothetical protein Glove_60g115 [Diversispora epigaea]